MQPLNCNIPKSNNFPHCEDSNTKRSKVICMGRYIPVSSNRTLHITFTGSKGGKGVTVQQIGQAFRAWEQAFIRESGFHPSRLSLWAVCLTQPETHIHAIATSARDRRTGKDITRLDGSAYRNLEGMWRDLMGKDASVKLTRVYDAKGIADYIMGPHNLGRTGQQSVELPSSLTGYN